MGGPNPPLAPQHPKTVALHGDVRVDPYDWLSERGSAEVIAYLESENAYAEQVLEPDTALREVIYREIVGRIQESDTSAPVFHKGWWSYTRTVERQEYEIYCRRRGSLEAEEEVILDVNLLASSRSFFELGYVERSPDEKLVAYAFDLDGSERHELRFRDLSTSRIA